MEMKVNIPFSQLLAFVKELSPVQKQKLRQQLDADVKGVLPNKTLSERLAGSITPAQAKKMHKELKQMRSEW